MKGFIPVNEVKKAAKNNVTTLGGDMSMYKVPAL